MRNNADKYCSYNSFYWKERKKGFHRPLGKKKGIISLIKIIKSLQINRSLRILDIGCGDGYILKYISSHLKNIKIEFYGLDRNAEVLSHAEKNVHNNNMHQFFFIEKEIADDLWTNDLGKFDVVFCVNVFHEVYSSLLFQKTPFLNKVFYHSINQIFTLVDKGGFLLLFDGIEQENALMRNVEFEILNAETDEKFNLFTAEYKTYPVSFKQLSNGIIRCNLFDFTRFITKLRFISTPTWNIEKNESYQYYTENEFYDLFNNNGMIRIESSQFICDVPEWEKNIRILNNSSFPGECFYILGRKK